MKNLAVLYFFALLSNNAAVAQSPVANFSASPLAGCSPLVVIFQDLSTGGAITWNWNFGNGNTSTLQHPTATYFTTGTYTVTLTVTNSAGSNTITRTNYITVYENPIVSFNANKTSGCFPLNVQFTDLSTGGNGNTNVSWLWDFGNGTTSTLQNPQNTYTTAGNFTVTLKVVNDKGCMKTITRPNYINVTPGVKADFTHTQSTTCTAPATISFTNTSTGPPTLSYLWDFGDGTFSSVLNPVHIYTTNGSYIVTLITFSTSGCEDTVRSVPIIIGGFVSSFNAPINACINEPVTFTNTSIPIPLSAYWTFGDGGSMSAINATHNYAATGTYTVWLYNDFGSCQDSISQAITINSKPTADFSAPLTVACQPPFTANFQDGSGGGISSWLWDFGDGATSTLQNPIHTYSSYGSFTVTLIVTNALGCNDTIVKTAYINVQKATISITGLPVQGCIPYTISPVPVINSVDPITTYQWDFGDGGSSNLANPIYTYTLQGTYTVRLIITSATGCIDTLTLQNAVKVGTKPVVNFSATPIPVCSRQPVYFTDLSAPADEWLWDFGDGGTSNLQNPTYSYNDTGYFTVRLIAINNGCRDTLIKTNYTYVLPPIARFIYTPSCSNRLTFSFTDQSTAPQTWSWDFGDGNSSTSQNPAHSYSSLGTYTVTLIVTNGGCADTTAQTINVVNENPDFSADKTVACKIALINFTTINIVPANIVNYFWDFGDGTQQNNSTPTGTANFTTSGTYTVTLITTDVNGCTDTTIKTNYIRINGPVANFTATNVNGCVGLSTTFQDASVPDGINTIINWQWNFGDGIVQQYNAPPFTHTYNAPGVFSIQLNITDEAGCKDSLLRPFLVTTVDPVPDFVSADTVTCPGATVQFTNNSAPSNVSSIWDFGDGSTSTIASPSHVYRDTGYYNIKLFIQHPNGCADSITRTSYIHVANPKADFSISDSISSCTPFQIQFNNTSTYYTSTLWNFGPGQGTSTLNDPVHYYSIAGTYPVKLIVTSPGGCLDSIIKTIRVYDTIGSRITYRPINGCKPLATTLNIFTTGPMVSYFWDFGDGYTTTSTTPDVNHIYSSPGNFLPKVIMQDLSGCQLPLQGFDTVFVTGANAKFGIDKNIFCDYATVNFIDSSIYNDPITSYKWTFGDGGISTLQHPVHNYTSPGIYSVQLIVQTAYGCLDTLLKPNLVKVVQRPLIDIGGDTSVCINSSILHTGVFIQADTSIVTWLWKFSDGSTSILRNPPLQTYKTTGDFTITTIATNSTGCKDTATQTIHVHPLPVVNMPGQMTVQNGFPVTIPATYSPNTIKWLWSPSGGLSCDKCPAPAANPKFNSFYQVYFTDTKGCSNTKGITVTVICKNANLFVPNTFSPNNDGSNELFYPRGKGLERVKLMRIFNRWGEVVYEKRDFPVNDASFAWNGTYKGKKPLADVYVYQIEVYCENGDIIKLNGNIALIL